MVEGNFYDIWRACDLVIRYRSLQNRSVKIMYNWCGGRDTVTPSVHYTGFSWTSSLVFPTVVIAGHGRRVGGYIQGIHREARVLGWVHTAARRLPLSVICTSTYHMGVSVVFLIAHARRPLSLYLNGGGGGSHKGEGSWTMSKTQSNWAAC